MPSGKSRRGHDRGQRCFELHQNDVGRRNRRPSAANIGHTERGIGTTGNRDAVLAVLADKDQRNARGQTRIANDMGDIDAVLFESRDRRISARVAVTNVASHAS